MTNLQAIDLLKDLEQRLDDYCGLNDKGKTAFRMAITALEVFGLSEQLPAAQQWIPCSERFPDEYVDVLVWFEYYRFGEYNRMYSTYGIGDYDAEYDKWWINHESGWRHLHVFAWMPLPEPYKT